MLGYLMYKKRLLIYTALSAAAALTAGLAMGGLSAWVSAGAGVYFLLLVHLSRAVDDLFDYDKDSRHMLSKRALSAYAAVLAALLLMCSIAFFGLRGLASAASVGYLLLMERLEKLTLLSLFVCCGCLFFMAQGADAFARPGVMLFLAVTVVLEAAFYAYKRSKRK